MSEMAMSPDIMALLGGGGAPAPPEAPVGDEGGDVLDLIRQALELVRQATASASDDMEALEYEKITTLLAKRLADEQKQQDDAMQGKASPRMLRQVYQG